jgi:hypothetical protein
VTLAFMLIKGTELVDLLPPIARSASFGARALPDTPPEEGWRRST